MGESIEATPKCSEPLRHGPGPGVYVLGLNSGPKCPGPKCPGPKCPGPKCRGPKCLGA